MKHLVSNLRAIHLLTQERSILPTRYRYLPFSSVKGH